MDESERPKTPYSIVCHTHERVFLTREEYALQMTCSDHDWICPICALPVWFDNDFYEETISERRRLANAQEMCDNQDPLHM
jgi:hypothetical protein